MVRAEDALRAPAAALPGFGASEVTLVHPGFFADMLAEQAGGAEQQIRTRTEKAKIVAIFGAYDAPVSTGIQAVPKVSMAPSRKPPSNRAGDRADAAENGGV